MDTESGMLVVTGTRQTKSAYKTADAAGHNVLVLLKDSDTDEFGVQVDPH